MTDALVPAVMHALEVAIIERLPNAKFHAVKPWPAWLTDAFAGGKSGPHGSLGEALPFLVDFLPQAEGVWKQGHPAQVESGPFAARIGGEDLLLRATALTAGLHAVLVIEHLTGIADSRAVLQKAREQLLEREQIVKQIALMRPAAAALAGAAAGLSESSLSNPQRTHVAAIDQALKTIASALDALPRPPQKTSRTKGAS